ncbi:MAG: HAD hydrolase-like protein, partial [Pseudolysinimonas sp.]
MDTDIVAGIEAGLHTVLVLTGISDQAEIDRYPFRPDEILDSVADLLSREPVETDAD